MMKFTYTTKHFSTGAIVETDCEFPSVEEFLRHINKWNIAGGGDYFYTARDAIVMPQGHGVHDFKTTRLLSQDRTVDDVRRAGGYWTPVTMV